MWMTIVRTPLISEIPFDLAFRGSIFNMTFQNVFWTLAFGLAAMMIYSDPFIASWQRVLGLFTCFFVPRIFHTDYSIYGVLTIFLMYIFRKEPIKMCMAGYKGSSSFNRGGVIWLSLIISYGTY